MSISKYDQLNDTTTVQDSQSDDTKTYKFKRNMSKHGFYISIIIFFLVCLALYMYFYK